MLFLKTVSSKTLDCLSMNVMFCVCSEKDVTTNKSILCIGSRADEFVFSWRSRHLFDQLLCAHMARAEAAGGH